MEAPTCSPQTHHLLGGRYHLISPNHFRHHFHPMWSKISSATACQGSPRLSSDEVELQSCQKLRLGAAFIRDNELPITQETITCHIFRGLLNYTLSPLRGINSGIKKRNTNSITQCKYTDEELQRSKRRTRAKIEKRYPQEGTVMPISAICAAPKQPDQHHRTTRPLKTDQHHSPGHNKSQTETSTSSHHRWSKPAEPRDKRVLKRSTPGSASLDELRDTSCKRSGTDAHQTSFHKSLVLPDR